MNKQQILFKIIKQCRIENYGQNPIIKYDKNGYNPMILCVENG